MSVNDLRSEFDAAADDVFAAHGTEIAPADRDDLMAAAVADIGEDVRGDADTAYDADERHEVICDALEDWLADRGHLGQGAPKLFGCDADDLFDLLDDDELIEELEG